MVANLDQSEGSEEMSPFSQRQKAGMSGIGISWMEDGGNGEDDELGGGELLSEEGSDLGSREAMEQVLMVDDAKLAVGYRGFRVGNGCDGGSRVKGEGISDPEGSVSTKDVVDQTN